MEATRRNSGSTAFAAGAALALAGCAALLLAVGDAIGFVSPSAEAVFTVMFVVGWVFLAWATIVGGAVLIHLIRVVAVGRRPALIETLLVVATAAVIAGVIFTHPLAGSGSGVG
jgi:hypothetical protein